MISACTSLALSVFIGRSPEAARSQGTWPVGCSATLTMLMSCSYDDNNRSWSKTFPCTVIFFIDIMTVKTFFFLVWSEWRSSITFCINKHESKIPPPPSPVERNCQGDFHLLCWIGWKTPLLFSSFFFATWLSRFPLRSAALSTLPCSFW